MFLKIKLLKAGLIVFLHILSPYSALTFRLFYCYIGIKGSKNTKLIKRRTMFMIDSNTLCIVNNSTYMLNVPVQIIKIVDKVSRERSRFLQGV